MNLEEIRNKLEEDEKNAKSSIDKLRDDINKRELKDLSENKDLHESNLLSWLEEGVKEDDSSRWHKYMLKLLRLFKKIGILSAIINIFHLLGRAISYVQDKLNWHGKNREQNETIRWVINLFFALILAVPIVFIKKILIIIFTK